MPTWPPGGPAADSATTLGPLGVKGVELGMHTWEDPAASLLDVKSGARCETFVIKVLGPKDGGEVDGFAGENLGVMALFAREGMPTPMGVGPGSSRTEVRRVYPGGEDIVPGYRVDVPGYPDRYYLFGFDNAKVESLVLALDEQTCFC